MKLFGSFDGGNPDLLHDCLYSGWRAFLTVALGFTGIPRFLAQWVGSLGLSPNMLLVTLSIFFVVLGCFLEGISIVVLTTAVIQPIIEQGGSTGSGSVSSLSSLSRWRKSRRRWDLIYS